MPCLTLLFSTPYSTLKNGATGEGARGHTFLDMCHTLCCAHSAVVQLVPGYREEIREPMDLGTVSSALASNTYRSPQQVGGGVSVGVGVTVGVGLDVGGGGGGGGWRGGWGWGWW